MNEAERIAFALVMAGMDNDLEAIHALTNDADPVLLANVAMNLAYRIAELAEGAGLTDELRAILLARLRSGSS
jgi:hypothetical protein